ncbi:MAG: M56 family metallopeptidase, partial [Gemmatimonadales bacterium]
MSVIDLVPVLAAKSAAILLLTIAAALGFRRSSAATRHLIWTGGLLASLALPVASLAGPRLPILPRGLWPREASGVSRAGIAVADAVAVAEEPAPPAGEPAAVASNRPVVAAMPATGVSPAAIASNVADIASVPPPNVAGLGPAPGLAAPARAAPPSPAGRAAPAAVAPALAGAGPIDWPALLTLGWLAGVGLALLRLLAGRIAIHRIARRAVPVVSPEWLDSIETALGQQDPGRPVRFLESAEAWTPCTWGTVHPTILLPTVGVDWSDEARRQVIVHELAHVRRYDCLTQVLGQLACAVQWFNPLAWLAARSARMAREQACDDAVLAAGSVPSEYAGLLLEAAAPEGSGPWVPAEALAMARRSQLGDRLLAVLDPARSREPVSRRRVAWTAVAALGLLLPVAAASPQEPRPPRPPRAAAVGRPPRAPAPTRPETPPRAPTPLGAAPAPAAPEAMDPLTPLPATAPTPVEPARPPGGAMTAPEAAEAPGLPPAMRPPAAPAPATVSPLEPMTTRAIPAPPRPPIAAADVPGDCRTDDRGRNRTVRLNSSVQITGTGSLSDGRGNVSVVWTGHDCSVIIRLRGAPTFTEAEDDLASLSSNGRFEITD